VGLKVGNGAEGGSMGEDVAGAIVAVGSPSSSTLGRDVMVGATVGLEVGFLVEKMSPVGKSVASVTGDAVPPVLPGSLAGEFVLLLGLLEGDLVVTLVGNMEEDVGLSELMAAICDIDSRPSPEEARISFIFTGSRCLCRLGVVSFAFAYTSLQMMKSARNFILSADRSIVLSLLLGAELAIEMLLALPT
jgi:hypothetical protein